MTASSLHAPELAARVRVALAPLIVFVLLWAPEVSHACSQCLATRTRANQLAFIWTTVFLSITPLLVVGGIAFWLRRRLQAHELAATREEALGSPADGAPTISRPAPIH